MNELFFRVWQYSLTKPWPCLDLLREGLVYKQIADRLRISEYTVKSHCRHIYEKLHVTTRGAAVHKYFDKRK